MLNMYYKECNYSNYYFFAAFLVPENYPLLAVLHPTRIPVSHTASALQ